jgi:hypothetical protein
MGQKATRVQTSQNPNSKRSRGDGAKPSPPTPKPNDTAAESWAKEVEKEIVTLSKLAVTDKDKLRSTIDELQREIRLTRLGDRVTKSSRNLEITLGTKSSLEKRLEECLTFLPEGITRRTMVASWNALYDAVILEDGSKSNIVTNHALKIIEKYGLEGSSLYLMSLEVLDIGLVSVKLASEIVRRIN